MIGQALSHYRLAAALAKPFLALELVEGEGLKERLARGAIPVDEALEIAEQIPEALEEAHNQGQGAGPRIHVLLDWPAMLERWATGECDHP